MEQRRVPQASELIYPPQPSWLPAFTALGLTVLVVGLFAGWVWALIGAVFFLVALVAWMRAAGREVSRLPREQRPATAVLPATTHRLEKS